MTAVGNVLHGIASVMWPVAIIVAAYLFRSEFAAMLGRVTHAKLPGVGVDLDRDLDRLQEATARLSKPQLELRERGVDDEADAESAENRILAEAAQSPPVALLTLSVELDRAIREILARMGNATLAENAASMVDAAAPLEGLLPSDTLNALTQFLDVRNRIIHGGAAASPEEILRAIDSGLVVLRAIRAVPLETNCVYHPAYPSTQIRNAPNCARVCSG